MTAPTGARGAASNGDRANDTTAKDGVNGATTNGQPRQGSAPPTAGSPPEPATPRGLTRAQIRRLVGLSAAIVLVGAVVGFGAGLLWPARYAARAEILYQISQEKSTGFLRQDRSLTTQLVLLQSPRVLAPVAAGSGMSLDDLKKKVSVTLLDNSEVIQVEARNHSRDTALRWVRDIVDNYLKVAPADQATEVDAFLRQQLAEVQDNLAKARVHAATVHEQQSAGLVGSLAGASADAEVQGLADHERKLREQLDELHVATVSAPRREVVVPPYPVANPVSPRPAFTAATGALASLVIAAGAAAVLGRRWARGRAAT
ncbi:hypothetical protein [Gandjariella thermophila]|uniref:hypothetical protein n=1 Tax=Gandjariella thermophila TaxID=1931992 RepID=UPI0010F71563|nr:hypothetical protein [Gandjariella thermophila]